MENDRTALVEQFRAVTGADEERSNFYLESSAWNIETALGSFYEESEDLGVAEDFPPAESASPAAASVPAAPSMPNISMDISDDSSSDEEGQAFYAGGSTNSGQQVLGPRRNKDKDVISKLFKLAKEHGAEVVDPKEDAKPKKKNTFGGTGYKLGETEDDHQVIEGAKKVEKPRDVILKMWKAGFTVDDGPLRSYTDPANAIFLESIKRGQIPLELVKSAKGGEVFINMEDHRNEEYIQAKKRVQAFGGTGNTLGSPAPEVLGQITNTGMPGGAASSCRIPEPAQDPKVDEEKAKEQLKVNTAEPTTNIQIRLPEGGRLVLKLNHTHTVGNIRQYTSTARPNLAPNFSLMTTFPYAELKEDSQTVVDAKLLNATIVIK